MVVSRVKIFGREVLYDFISRHAEVRGQVVVWLADVEDADWKTPQDVRVRYPSVSFIGARRAVFNLKGRKYRLDTSIAFNTGVVSVNRIGTHAEYSNWTF